ncbi:hypothetical protein [Microbacterium sp. NPDC087589]|uniref:hypothetical protein n=1 Tax=Microbacterium sp. NPDC087589 TaxID=3364191 RepID=UPI0038249781
MSAQPVHPDDFVSDITVEIGLAVRDRLAQRFPGRLRKRVRDSPLTTIPGHTIFVPSSESFTAACTIESACDQMLPILLRDLRHQLDDARISEASATWSLAFTWDGHGLFDDGQFVRDGYRFDAYLQVVREAAS